MRGTSPAVDTRRLLSFCAQPLLVLTSHPPSTSAALASPFPEPPSIFYSTAVAKRIYSFFFPELKLLLSERHTFMQTVFQIRFIKREVHLSNVYYTQKTDYRNGAVNLVTRLNILITC